ncbi:hypothetical protein F2P56_017032 [Juglans regia]|uniref:Uncharacterized protein n=2 Tax=Juglans regia TaxID=51240 RepID=A0A833XHI8_JUGRE|nr:uncharacterized protein LOC108997120 isoform X2 [Juglans regia]KAF5467177.1 hypothetical protein F2P56_017032 [Juglans regia]
MTKRGKTWCLSNEDLALKQQLESYVERAQDPDPGLQKVALESMSCGQQRWCEIKGGRRTGSGETDGQQNWCRAAMQSDGDGANRQSEILKGAFGQWIECFPSISILLPRVYYIV